MRILLFVIPILLLILSCSKINKNQEIEKGIRLYEADSLKEAVTTFSDVLSTYDTCYNCYLYRGWAYKELKEYNKALQDFNTLISIGINNDVGYANRASIYYLKNNHAAALKDYLSALKINPKAKILYNPISHMLFSTGQKKQACEYYEKSLEINDTTFDRKIVEYCRNKNYH